MTTIREILHGLKAGRLQTVGRMQMIPLSAESDSLHDDRFVAPCSSVSEVSTQNYGEMAFRNKTDKILVVPSHTGYVVKQAAQNHAMSSMGMIPAKAGARFNNARCVQQTQGGLIHPGDHEDEMVILPFSLREAALDGRKHGGYDAMWPHISRFNRGMGCAHVGNLDVFLSRYERQLDEFVAEFEITPRQIGAIILVDGEVVGIERAPSPSFWRTVFRHVVRECYGSLCLERDVAAEKANPGRARPGLKSRVRLQTKGINTLDDLEEAIDKARASEERKVKKIVRDLLDEPFQSADEQGVSGLKAVTVRNTQFKGQMILDGLRVCYASLFTGKSWEKNAPWVSASKFAL